MAIYGHKAGEINREVNDQFFEEVVKGLTASPKYLLSKYFYDKNGDHLFQQIMKAPEYYLTNSEAEIFRTSVTQMAEPLLNFGKSFDIIELGAGDATKSKMLLKYLLEKNASFTYYPIDISENVIRHLEKQLPREMPELNIDGLNGEYFEMLQKAYKISNKKKLVMFLGANIGNFRKDEANHFLQKLRNEMSKDDLLLIGFDLKKNPRVILDAYNDAEGYTRAFNLNLLSRMNKELNADFDLQFFDHYPTYDPISGACKSYLISLKKQQVTINDSQVINFEENEPIYMEISQKYAVTDTDNFAHTNSFEPVSYLFDSKRWFVDIVWKCK